MDVYSALAVLVYCKRRTENSTPNDIGTKMCNHVYILSI